MSYIRNGEVEEFTLSSLTPSEKPVLPDEDFSFQSLENSNDLIGTDKLKQENDFANESFFKIDKNVDSSRGLKKQRDDEFEQRVESEVKARLERLSSETKEVAYNEGYQAGLVQAKEETSADSRTYIEQIKSEVEKSKDQLGQILAKRELETYRLVKNLVKWIALQEIQDKDYVKRLLQKLILEINSKNNLLIKVNPEIFKGFDSIISDTEKIVGPLTNVRVEVAASMSDNGIIIESENGIIDGSIDAQFESLDKLFEKVGVDE